MRKSVIIATVTIVIAVALVASYVWYDDGKDNGGDTPENTGPVLSNYINTSTFFDAYKDGKQMTPFDLPYSLEQQGNIIELRPTNHVSSVTYNGDGAYAFTLTTEPGATYTLTVELRNVSNLESSVSDGVITITFDAMGMVTLIMDADVYGDIVL